MPGPSLQEREAEERICVPAERWAWKTPKGERMGMKEDGNDEEGQCVRTVWESLLELPGTETMLD